ncbi:hypothetical protein [Mesorhizobium sp. LNJC394B00]|nr:hypothetical protein [Mesorhizobium sp. LNJC394B00]ESY15410.1 hypothetical protein X750_28520 [Mesorhizobium sp. LNJC394B00]
MLGYKSPALAAIILAAIEIGPYDPQATVEVRLHLSPALAEQLEILAA